MKSRLYFVCLCYSLLAVVFCQGEMTVWAQIPPELLRIPVSIFVYTVKPANTSSTSSGAVSNSNNNNTGSTVDTGKEGNIRIFGGVQAVEGPDFALFGYKGVRGCVLSPACLHYIPPPPPQPNTACSIKVTCIAFVQTVTAIALFSIVFTTVFHFLHNHLHSSKCSTGSLAPCHLDLSFMKKCTIACA